MQPTMSQIQFKDLNSHRKATKDKALRELGLCNSRFRTRGLVLMLSQHQHEQNRLWGVAVAMAPVPVRQSCWSPTASYTACPRSHFLCKDAAQLSNSPGEWE